MMNRAASAPPLIARLTGCDSGSVAVRVCTNVLPSATAAVAGEVTVGGVLLLPAVNTVRLFRLIARGSPAALNPMPAPSNNSCPLASVPPLRSVRVMVSATTSKLPCATPATVSLPLTASSSVPAASTVPLKLVAWVSRCRPWIG